jgi:hypothetical protein
MAGTVYVICSIGPEGEATRRRADEVSDYIIAPVAKEFDLAVERSDRDPKPGQITTQILRGILDATVIVADLTGLNANVFYELAFAQSFGKPTVLLIDRAETLPFDTRNERVIEIGDAGSPISMRQGEDAKSKLRATLQVVLAPGYQPASLITDVASTVKLASLEPENPLAAEVAQIRAMVEEVVVLQRRSARLPRLVPDEIPSEAVPSQRFKEGIRVQHPKYGVGTILKSTMTRAGEEVVIRFAGAGMKIFAVADAQLMPLDEESPG